MTSKKFFFFIHQKYFNVSILKKILPPRMNLNKKIFKINKMVKLIFLILKITEMKKMYITIELLFMSELDFMLGILELLKFVNSTKCYAWLLLKLLVFVKIEIVRSVLINFYCHNLL